MNEKWLNAPFYFNVQYKLPSKLQSEKNAKHIDYIANRPGVELNNEIKLEEIGEGLENIDYAQYMDERPRSHGLFDQDGPADIEKVKDELKSFEGTTWRAILSLREDDAKRLNYMEKEAWENTLRATMADAANQMNIKESNLKWYAAYHQEKGHPHVHVIFWDSSCERTRNTLSRSELKKMRKVFTDQIYQEERTQLNIEKTAMRDLIRSLGEENVQTITKLSKELDEMHVKMIEQKILNGQADTSISPKIRAENIKIIGEQLKELAEIMPSTGRIAMAYMPQEVKEKATEIAQILLNQPQFKEAVARYEKASRGLTRIYSHKPEDLKKATENAMEDIRKRIAQLVLKGAATLKRKDFLILDHTKVGKTIKLFKNAEGLLNNKNLNNFARALLIMGQNKEQTQKILLDFNERSKGNIEINKINEIVTKQVAKIADEKNWGQTSIINKKDWEELSKELGIKANWIFKSNIEPNLVNSIWKATWRNIEKELRRRELMLKIEERQIEMQAEYIRRKQEELSR